MCSNIYSTIGGRVAFFITKEASKWARSEGCTDEVILSAIREMEQGLMGNALGACLYKKRVAIPGAGKSGGWRIIIATKLQDDWFVLHGFAKNVQANINSAQLADLKQLGKAMLALNKQSLQLAIASGFIRELYSETLND